MTRFTAVVLFGVLILGASGFATSKNRFDTRTILNRTPGRTAQAAQAGNSRSTFAKPQKGRNQAAANLNQPHVLHQNLERRGNKGLPR